MSQQAESADAGQVLFHVGMPKCASSTLQKHVFCEQQVAQNFGLYPTGNVAGSNAIGSPANAVYLQDPALFRFYKQLHNDPGATDDQLRAAWQELIARHRDDRYGRVLLSHEAMTSFFFSRNTPQEKARRIAALFPGARILLVVRHQLGWLQSQYRDHPFDPRRLHNGKPVGFDEWVGLLLSEPALEGARAAIRYAQVVDTYRQHFGAGRVQVLPFEDLVARPDRFAARICDFLGTDDPMVGSALRTRHENRGVSGLYNRLRQVQRGAAPGSLQGRAATLLLKLGFLKDLPRAALELAPGTWQRLVDVYGEDNRRLAGMVDLAPHRYPGLAPS